MIRVCRSSATGRRKLTVLDLTCPPPCWEHRCVRSRLALAVVLVLVVPASGARAEVSARSVQAPAAGDLFVLTAAGGKLERVRGRNRVLRLVLRRPARDVTGFLDRPARTTGQQPLARFVGRWASLGFAEVPPNAAVVLADAPSDRDVLVVELSRPRLGARGRTLAFRAELLRATRRTVTGVREESGPANCRSVRASKPAHRPGRRWGSSSRCRMFRPAAWRRSLSPTPRSTRAVICSSTRTARRGSPQRRLGSFSPRRGAQP